MKIFNFLIALSSIITLTSCNDDNDGPYRPPSPPTLPEKEAPKFSLTASKNIINLFEGSRLSLNRAEQNGLNLLDLSLSVYYDSVLWIIPDIYKHKSTQSGFRLGHEQVFSLPGKYTVSVLGFKNGQIEHKDSVKIEVAEPKDFLGIDWKTATDTLFVSFENDAHNYYLNLSYSSKEYPHALLKYYGIRVHTDKEWIKSREESRNFLFEYITQLYGKSTFRFDGANISDSPLISEYNLRFRTPLIDIDKKKSIPIAIWETSTSNIALIGKNNFEIEDHPNFYEVIAEPKQSAE